MRKCYDRDCRIGMKHLQTPSENKFFSASTVKIAFTVVAVLTVCTNPITETSEALYNSGTINHTGISIITLTIFLHVLVPSIMILSLTLLKYTVFTATENDKNYNLFMIEVKDNRKVYCLAIYPLLQYRIIVITDCGSFTLLQNGEIFITFKGNCCKGVRFLSQKGKILQTMVTFIIHIYKFAKTFDCKFL